MLLTSTSDALHELEAEAEDIAFDNWPSDKLQEARALGQLLDSMAKQLYFASGAFEYEKSEKGEEAAGRFTSVKKTSDQATGGVPLAFPGIEIAQLPRAVLLQPPRGE